MVAMVSPTIDQCMSGVAHFDRFHFSFNCFACQRAQKEINICSSSVCHNLLNAKKRKINI